MPDKAGAGIAPVYSVVMDAGLRPAFINTKQVDYPCGQLPAGFFISGGLGIMPGVFLE